jgi:hypothetical protein
MGLERQRREELRVQSDSAFKAGYLGEQAIIKAFAPTQAPASGIKC